MRVASDTPLSGGSTTADAAAYTNSAPGATAATLYTLDAASNALFIQGFMGAGTPAGPNGGVQGNPLPVTLNGQALDFTAVSGFDIPAGVRAATANAAVSGFGFAALTVGTTTSLYQIDLATGAATSLGAIGTGVSGLALSDEPGGTVSIQGATFGVEGDGLRTFLTRTGGDGPLTAAVSVTGGTATPGVDFPAGPYFVTFAAGQTTVPLFIPLTLNPERELSETVNLTITGVVNGQIGSPASVTLTVVDAFIPGAGPAVSQRIVSDQFGTGVEITYANGGVEVASAEFFAASYAVLGPVPVATALIGDLNGGGPEVAIMTQFGFIFIYDPQARAPLAIVADMTGDGVLDIIFRVNGEQGALVAAFFYDGRTGRITRLR